jgi:signal peptidase II
VGSWFHGQVVDMLYFPIIETHYPSWSPINAGEEFIFFRPVFNLADASISTGVIAIFVFQKRFFAEHVKPEVTDVPEDHTPAADTREGDGAVA